MKQESLFPIAKSGFSLFRRNGTYIIVFLQFMVRISTDLNSQQFSIITPSAQETSLKL